MLRIEKVDEHNIKNNEYKHEPHSYVIIENNQHMAYLHFRMKDSQVMWLDMIEVIEKRKGLGTKIIYFLFQHFGLQKIEGFSFCEERAYRFWEQLGAKFYYVEEEGYEIDELLDTGLESPFTLVLE